MKPNDDINPDHLAPTNITTQLAWRRHPRATSTEAACKAEALQSSIESDFNRRMRIADLFGALVNYDVIRHEATASTWERLEGGKRSLLPDSQRTSMSASLENSEAGNRLRQEIFNTTYGTSINDPAYSRWQNTKTAELLDRVSRDPAIINAEKKWDKKDIREKLALTQHIHNIQAQVFGFAPTEVIPFMEGPKADSKATASTGVQSEVIRHAYYSDPENRIAMNIYRDADTSTSIHGKFSEFMDTVVHEGEHTFQFRLAAQAEQVKAIERSVLSMLDAPISHHSLSPEGQDLFHSEMQRRIKAEIPADPGKWNQELYGDSALASHADYIIHNIREMYMSDDMPGVGHEGYESNPIEQESRKVGVMVAGYFDKEPDQRSNYIAALRSDAYKDGQAEIMRQQDRTKTMSQPGLCNP